MIKAAIYARYSSDAQRQESIEDQNRICRKYCEEHGMTVVIEYADRALSGLSDNRPQFQQMIKDGEKHLFDALVLYSLDRFARNKYDSAIYKSRLKKAGIKICYVTTPIGEGAEATLIESIYEGMAQYYSENLARSVRRGMEGNALKGKWNGVTPLGYKKNKEKYLEPDPIYAPIVKRLFDEYATGKQLAEIIRDINASGARTPTGRLFTRNSFSTALTNPVYKGTYHWHDIIIEDSVPPLISKETFEKVQQLMIDNHNKPGHFKSKEEYILSGKIFCGMCGSPMIGECGKSHTGAVHYYYTCANRKRPQTPSERCNKKVERKSILEENIVRMALEALTDDAIEEVSEAAHNMLQKEADQANRIPALKAQLKEITDKLNNIMDAIEHGIYNSTTKQRMDDLIEQKETLENLIAETSAPLPVLTKEQIAFYLYSIRNGSAENPDYYKRLVNTFINSITVFDEGENKKIALVLNLKTNATRTYSGSDLSEKIHHHASNPNHIILLDTEHFLYIAYCA